MSPVSIAPISAEHPCGVDITGDPILFELDQLVRGKPGTQFSEAEDADWRAVRTRCESTLERSKHLVVLVYYLVALLETESLPGFADGLELLQGIVVGFWESLFPSLDPTDGNDPTERMSILSGLATPLGSYEDPLRVIERLRRTALFSVPRIGSMSLDRLVTKPAGEESNESAFNEGQIAAMLSDANQEELAQTQSCLERGLRAIQSIDVFLESTVGSASAPSWEPLIATLKEQQRVFGRSTVRTSVGTPLAMNGIADSTASSLDVNITTPAEFSENGAIRGRQDVIRSIDAICDYYRQQEPSSAVPFLLQRAKGLVTKNFLDTIQDLAPEAIPQVKIITGEQKV